jgi:hypothetical protein
LVDAQRDLETTLREVLEWLWGHDRRAGPHGDAVASDLDGRV